jgi:phage portal protein BeeE
MGIRAYLRGDDLASGHEQRMLAPQEAQPSYPPPYWSQTTPLNVSESTALRVSDAWACVRALSDSVASLPVHVFRRTSAGRVRVGDEARAVQLLNRPSPGATACDLFGTAMAHLLVNGNAFVAKYRSDAEIVQLGLIDPRQVEVELRGQQVVYVITTNGRAGIDTRSRRRGRRRHEGGHRRGRVRLLRRLRW